MKWTKVLLALLLACLLLAGCQSGSEPTLPFYSRPNSQLQPLIPTRPTTGQQAALTAVYVSVFGDMAILSTSPITEWAEEEMIGQPREISSGGRIGGKDENGQTIRITKVMIQDVLVPRSTRDWFRDLPQLVAIQGLELVDTRFVTDMSHMFSGCMKLSQINADGWNVGNVNNMLGIFDDCLALSQKPIWYPEES